jgi:hypothetical protein
MNAAVPEWTHTKNSDDFLSRQDFLERICVSPKNGITVREKIFSHSYDTCQIC